MLSIVTRALIDLQKFSAYKIVAETSSTSPQPTLSIRVQLRRGTHKEAVPVCTPNFDICQRARMPHGIEHSAQDPISPFGQESFHDGTQSQDSHDWKFAVIVLGKTLPSSFNLGLINYQLFISKARFFI